MKFINSTMHAIKGIVYTLKTERNFRIQIVIAIITIILGFYYKLNSIEWMFISSAIFRVLSYETINTSVENLSDVCEKKKDIDIKHIKDTSASYVLLSAIYSVVIGLIIFIPKIFL